MTTANVPQRGDDESAELDARVRRYCAVLLLDERLAGIAYAAGRAASQAAPAPGGSGRTDLTAGLSAARTAALPLLELPADAPRTDGEDALAMATGALRLLPTAFRSALALSYLCDLDLDEVAAIEQAEHAVLHILVRGSELVLYHGLSGRLDELGLDPYGALDLAWLVGNLPGCYRADEPLARAEGLAPHLAALADAILAPAPGATGRLDAAPAPDCTAPAADHTTAAATAGGPPTEPALLTLVAQQPEATRRRRRAGTRVAAVGGMVAVGSGLVLALATVAGTDPQARFDSKLFVDASESPVLPPPAARPSRTEDRTPSGTVVASPTTGAAAPTTSIDPTTTSGPTAATAAAAAAALMVRSPTATANPWAGIVTTATSVFPTTTNPPTTSPPPTTPPPTTVPPTTEPPTTVPPTTEPPTTTTLPPVTTTTEPPTTTTAPPPPTTEPPPPPTTEPPPTTTTEPPAPPTTQPPPPTTTLPGSELPV